MSLRLIRSLETPIMLSSSWWIQWLLRVRKLHSGTLGMYNKATQMHAWKANGTWIIMNPILSESVGKHALEYILHHCIFWILVFVMITFLIFPTSFSHFISKTPRTYLYNSLEAWIFGVWCQMPSAFLPSSKPFNNVNSFGHMHCTWRWRQRPWRALRWWMVSLVFWVQHSSGRRPWWSWIRWWNRRCFCWDVGGV